MFVTNVTAIDYDNIIDSNSKIDYNNITINFKNSEINFEYL